MRKLVLATGAIQSSAIFVYGLSIVVSGTISKSKAGSPLVQFLIYTFFAVSLAATTWGISKYQEWARTPFYILQVFIVITGYTLISGTESIYKITGVIVGVCGITGFIALLRTPTKS